MNSTHRFGSLAERVFARLRSDIIGGEFAPGSRLGMDSMRSRYGVGISPLREALSRLATHGLVTQESQRGFRVREASAEDLRDIAATRIQVECLTLRQSIARGDDVWEARVISAHHLLGKLDLNRISLNSEEWELRHRSFHFTILEACGSRGLLQFCGLLHDQFDFYRRLAGFIGRRQPHLAAQHGKLVSALKARRAEAAAQVLAAHIAETADAVARELNFTSSRRSSVRPAAPSKA
jgi:GntR family transcriptional regulator, carbon starvation induced regulator